MKKILYISLSIVLMLWASSCSLVDYNIDPTRQSDVNLSLIMPSMLSQAAFNQSANPARVTGIIMQQFEGLDAQQLAYQEYVIPEITFNNYWRTGLYAGVLKDTKSIIDKAQAEDEPYYEGIAKIIQANEYGSAAAYFGDIPFSKALLGVDDLKPAYDTQEQVYAGVQSLLNEAIELLGRDGVISGIGGDDLIFGGDADKWLATAHALKARYLMHLTKRNGASAATSALTELASAFTSVADQPEFTFENTQIGNNPIAKFGVERPGTLGFNPGFAQSMMDSNDPRMSAYVDTAGGNFNFFSSGLVWAQNNSSIPMISYAEVKFLEAEALLWTGAADGDIDAALAAAITASMDQVGVDPADYETYVATNGTVAGLSGTDAKLEKIMNEAYVAYYGCAFQQTYVNFLRNGYPTLTPNSAGDNGLNPGGAVPRRYLYPSSENQLNAEAWQAAVDRAGGGALMNVNTWAFE